MFLPGPLKKKGRGKMWAAFGPMTERKEIAL